MLQLVYRADYKMGYQIRSSIVFYQKSKHKKYLGWLKRIFKCGYIRDRKDNISEYTIVGHDDVIKILKMLQPYLRLKKRQASLAVKIIEKVQKIDLLTPKLLLSFSKSIDKFAMLNYSKKRTNNSKKVEYFLRSKNFLSL